MAGAGWSSAGAALGRLWRACVAWYRSCAVTAARMEGRERARQAILQRAAGEPFERQETGLAALDDALGGGLPCERVVEVAGEPGCGKMTLALQIAGHLQQRGGMVAMAIERKTLRGAYARQLGVEPGGLLRIDPARGAETFVLAERLLRSRALALLVVDALALVPGEADEAQADEENAEAWRELLAQGRTTLARALVGSGCCCLVLTPRRMIRAAAQRLQFGEAVAVRSARGVRVGEARVLEAVDREGEVRGRVRLVRQGGGGFRASPAMR